MNGWNFIHVLKSFRPCRKASRPSKQQWYHDEIMQLGAVKYLEKKS